MGCWLMGSLLAARWQSTLRNLIRSQTVLVGVRHESSDKGHTGTGTTTVDNEEVSRFARHADSWWDESGDFAALHALNHLRVQLVRDGLLATHIMPPQHSPAPFPLVGFQILDVGCGGGILVEPLARLGAKTTGLDVCPESIEVAKLHVTGDPLVLTNATYVCQSVEKHLDNIGPKAYHGVVASEVVEHVNNPPLFLESCIKLLKPGGSLFLTTLNRTTPSWLLGVVVAEKVLKIVPPGTHDWNKFITPKEMRSMLDQYGCRTNLVHGMMYNPILNRWWWVPYTGMSYALHAVKDLK